MAEDQRPIERRVADAPLVEPMEIGPAQPDGLDADHLLARRGCDGLRRDPDVTASIQSSDQVPIARHRP
jgi:hypothetical protein